MRDDEELNKLLSGVKIAQGGVLPKFATKEKWKWIKEVNGFTNYAKAAIFIATLFGKTLSFVSS